MQDSAVGTAPEVRPPSFDPTEETKYTVGSPAQAITICQSLLDQWEKGVANAATITHYLNGAPPRNPALLAQFGRAWFPNCSVKFLKNLCAIIATGFSRHILRASSLTNAQLPTGWPNAQTKNAVYRQEFSEMVRGWSNWPWWVVQTSNEVSTNGFAYAVFFDEFSWRPEFVSSTRGFVPIGTRVSDEDGPPFFMVRYDYRPNRLLKLVRKAAKSGLGGWNAANVAAAISSADAKTNDGSAKNRREQAEKVRDATSGKTYENAFRTVQTWHLFSTDADGSVSHHILLADDAAPRKGRTREPLTDGSSRLLFERRNRFKSMNDAVVPILFDPETGKIHGSWGVGQHCFDIALEYEKRFNDLVAQLIMSGKIKVQADKGVNPAEVKLMVDDVLSTLTNAVYAGNVAAVPTDPAGFRELLQMFANAAREIVGNLIPPIPQTPDDVKAAQIDAKLQEQQERREQNLDMQLIQFAKLTNCMARRALQKEADDLAKNFVKRCKDAGLTDEELKLLTGDSRMKTILDFTEYAAKQRAAFAAAKAGNPFYNQKELERVQAEAIGGPAFAASVLLPGDDATVERDARRQQAIETGAMKAGQVIDVLPGDADWFHMQELRPELENALTVGAASGDFDLANRMLTHYTSHWVGASSKKGFPPGYSGNNEKAFIAKAAQTIQTGQPPPDGFADKQDVIAQVEQQMTQQPVVSGPSLPAIDATSARGTGLKALVENSA